MKSKITKLKTVNTLSGYTRYKTINDKAQKEALEKIENERLIK